MFLTLNEVFEHYPARPAKAPSATGILHSSRSQGRSQFVGGTRLLGSWKPKRSQISQLIQMRSPSANRIQGQWIHPAISLGSTRFFDRCERFSHLHFRQRTAAAMPLRPQLPTGLVQRLFRGIPYRTLRANVECARSELRRHRLQPRRSHYRFLRIGETLSPSRFHCRAVEFVVL
jgi:hypothetical protein